MTEPDSAQPPKPPFLRKFRRAGLWFGVFAGLVMMEAGHALSSPVSMVWGMAVVILFLSGLYPETVGKRTKLYSARAHMVLKKLTGPLWKWIKPPLLRDGSPLQMWLAISALLGFLALAAHILAQMTPYYAILFGGLIIFYL